MTEAEWLAATNPYPMLESRCRRAPGRKLRLFACACARRLWHLLGDGPGRRAVEAAERHADGAADGRELAAALADARAGMVAWYRSGAAGVPAFVVVENVALPNAYRAACDVSKRAASYGNGDTAYHA